MKHLYDVPAPAKLNLFLHITGRRDDGYHLLQSAMVMVDWCDTLHFELRADGAISREDLRTPLPENDLTIRAARALQAARAGRTPPAAAIWLSLIRIASESPKRWLKPPPWWTAIFSTSRSPGVVFRVQVIRAAVQRVSAT